MFIGIWAIFLLKTRHKFISDAYLAVRLCLCFRRDLIWFMRSDLFVSSMIRRPMNCSSKERMKKSLLLFNNVNVCYIWDRSNSVEYSALSIRICGSSKPIVFVLNGKFAKADYIFFGCSIETKQTTKIRLCKQMAFSLNSHSMRRNFFSCKNVFLINSNWNS